MQNLAQFYELSWL